ncbi:collagen alpha-1(XII) chain-like [Dreissena polymorpha]|uniref:collagen alpha-1(XII) chain-like n=1 Tax=Dreissena polymorpha TaxID=45954 RepID=UPI00226418EE|nr:collagen alpha-1(XII) chain-like [Dreissena polymorpha]
MATSIPRQAVLENGASLPRFLAFYRELVSRIRARHGSMQNSCRISLTEVERFMNLKQNYERMFREFCPDGRLLKDDLMGFFNRCDLWPTQGDINRSFDKIFRGSRNTAEVVFVLDCSNNSDVVDFRDQIKFVRAVVDTLDIAPDRTRVGVVPYNEDVYNAFGINQYSNKGDVLEAISRIKLCPGLTRTDLALRLMQDMFKDSRPGVQKMAIVVIDAPSAAREKTRAEVLRAHDMGVEIFAIGIGPEVDEEELAHMASTPEHVFLVHDTRSLVLVRRHLEHRFRLDSQSTPYVASNKSHVCRPLSQSETLEIVWTAYPPEACDLQDKARSRWIRPVVGGKEAYALLDDDIIRQTGIRPCLQLVIQSRLRRDGFIILPSDVREGVQRVTNEAQALDLIDKFIKDRRWIKIL